MAPGLAWGYRASERSSFTRRRTRSIVRTFEPVIVPKRAGRVAGGPDEMITSLYAHGMGVDDVQHHLRQANGTELSHEANSNITDQVMNDVMALAGRGQ